MQRTIKIWILSSILLPLSLFAQADSTVYLKPVLNKGSLINFKLKNSVVTEKNGQGNFSNDGYYLKMEVLKSAYGLSVVKMGYDAFGEDHQSGSNLKIKDDLSVLFTIDSNQRFLAIEYPELITESLNKRLKPEEHLDSKDGSLDAFFPEIELLFFLNGAKYVKGETYETESMMFVGKNIYPCKMLFSMTSFSRQKNEFEIVCTIELKEKEVDLKEFSYKMHFTYRLSDLIPLKIESRQAYQIADEKYNMQVTISKN